MVQRVAAEISIPFTVGGGINELAAVERLLNAGADKVSVNSAALRNPGLINEITGHFGSQVCVVAIDAKETEEGWFCYLNGGYAQNVVCSNGHAKYATGEPVKSCLRPWTMTE